MARVDMNKEDMKSEPKMAKKKGNGPTFKKRNNNSNGITKFKLSDSVSRIKITSDCSPKLLDALSEHANLTGVTVSHSKR